MKKLKQAADEYLQWAQLWAYIFQNPLLIKVLKCFDLPYSPLPTRGSGEERLIQQKRMFRNSSFEQI